MQHLFKISHFGSQGLQIAAYFQEQLSLLDDFKGITDFLTALLNYTGLDLGCTME